MSTGIDGAAAHAAEKMVKPASPRRKTRRRPKMSPSRAPAISRTANASVYPALIHCSVEAPPPRSRRTDGPAIVAMVESIASMMLAVMTTMRTSQRRRNG